MHINLLTYLILFCYAVGYFFWGERIPVHGGLGWDGITYAAYAKNFIEEITTNADLYHVSRCLPSFLLWLSCKLLHVQLDSPESIFNAFFILNNVCFFLIYCLWSRICQLKRFSLEVQLMGTLCFFCNFSFLKFYQYDPVLTDVFALLLGMSALYFYLKKSFIFLNLLLIPTMFTWPVGIVFISILILFSKPESKVIFRQNSKLALLIALVYGMILLVLSKLPYSTQMWELAGTHISTRFVFLSVFFAGCYVFLILRSIQFDLLLRSICHINKKNLLFYFFFITITVSTYHFVSHLSLNHSEIAKASSPNILSFLFFYIFTGPLLKPGLFFTMQVVNWGPAAFLYLVFCREMFKKAWNEGIGLTFILLISFYFSLNPQYRFNTFLIPVTIYLLCSVMQNLKINFKFCQLYFLISLLCSKVYYSLNLGYVPVNPTVEELYTTSVQKLLMNSGYWVSGYGYTITMALTIVVGLLLSLLRIKKKNLK